jgi:hypothetical protein
MSEDDNGNCEDEEDTDSLDLDYDSDFDEEYDFDTDNLATIERVCDDDHFDTLHTNKKWFIGLSLNQYDYYIYLIHVSPASYFKYPHDIVRRYLRRYSCMELPKDAKIELMMMVIEHVNLNGIEFDIKKVVLKTYWIRLIQRCWRNTLKRRREMIMKWASPRNRKHVEMTGRNLPEYRRLPSLYGCLHQMHKKQII